MAGLFLTPNSIFHMNLHILIAFLGLGPASLQAPAELKLTNLTAGVKESRQVYLGINNEFSIDDSSAVELLYHPFAKLENKILTVSPCCSGPVDIRLVRDGDTLDVQFIARTLARFTASPAAAQGKQLSKTTLALDSAMNFVADGEDDYYKGYKLASFNALVNNTNFTCDTSFCASLMEAVRLANEGDLLRITTMELVHAETGKVKRIKCNIPFTITQ